jgi:hypothetical protein
MMKHRGCVKHLARHFAVMMRGYESRIFNFKASDQLAVSAINALKCALMLGFKGTKRKAYRINIPQCFLRR